MSEWIKRLIESKHAYRAKLAALPFEEKIKLLEKLRARTISIQPVRQRDLLEGVRSPHVPYDAAVLDRIRQNSKAQA